MTRELMQKAAANKAKLRGGISTLLLVFAIASCTPAAEPATGNTMLMPWQGWIPAADRPAASLPGSPAVLLTPSASPVAAAPLPGTPTPDPLRDAPLLRDSDTSHIVQWGESLNTIAELYQVSSGMIIRANSLINPDLLQAGQYLYIPAPIPQPPGPSFKILPDSELVNGPAGMAFDIFGEVVRHNGYLLSYSEEVEGVQRSGAAIVDLVSRRYSINPRLLLAVLDYQSGWLRQSSPGGTLLTYPMGYQAYGWEGLFSQLSLAADQLNQGYYRWRAGWLGPYLLQDGHVISPGPGLNAGTVAVQQLFSSLYGGDRWREVVSESGFSSFYKELFGDPFARRVEPQLPLDLAQPDLQLPFEAGKDWSFTGGPHSAWGDWAAWAALDFAPPGNAYGCVHSNEWVVASANGVVVRAEDGEVVLDLDGDGFEQTGWVLLYMHIETRQRIEVGTAVSAGVLLGHPSCEGGVTTGTHLHFARKYNGEWIPADGSLPVILDGWTSSGQVLPYDGFLTKGVEQLEACACRNEFNQISR